MNAKTLLIFTGGVIVGLIMGVALSSLFVAPTTSTGSRAPAPVAPQQGGQDRLRLQQELTQMEQVVKSDPKNYRAWVGIGNNRFDLGDSKGSIEGYRKALELDDSDANVWTDMGIMYRRIGDFQMALESFQAAMQRDPTHALSRMNAGIVYVNDLNQYDKGIEAWEAYLKIVPSGPQADDVRRQIEEVKSRGGAVPAPAGQENYFPKPAQP